MKTKTVIKILLIYATVALAALLCCIVAYSSYLDEKQARLMNW